MEKNYGKEALELAEEVSYKVRQDQQLDRTTINFHKYAMNLNLSQTVTMPTFIGQAGSSARFEASYFLEGVSGKIKVVLNDKPIQIFDITGHFAVDFILDAVNVLELEISLNQTGVARGINLSLSGQLRKPALNRDLMTIDNFGYCIYQAMPSRETYKYNFNTFEDMVGSNTSLTPAKTYSDFVDYTYKYTDGVKSGRIELLLGLNMFLSDGDLISITSNIGNVQAGCVSPSFSSEYDYLVYYSKDDKLYYSQVGDSFSAGVEISLPLRYGLNKLISLKNVKGDQSYLPHFCFIDKNSDAYFVLCEEVGSYSRLQKIGKAESLVAYIDYSGAITIFLAYQDVVTRIDGSINEFEGKKSFCLDGKSKLKNVDSVGMDSLGKIYYKSRNCIYEDSNS